jgi:subtilisin family serine protease
MQYLSLSLVLSIIPVLTQANYILTPKEHVSALKFFDLSVFTKEHYVEQLASFGDLTVYKTSVKNYKRFSSTLNAFFDVEEDQVVTLPEYTTRFVESMSESMSEPVQPWHLGRIVNRNLSSSDQFPYTASGSCHTNKDIDIHTYVIDTGIDTSHPEFEGRATWLANFADNQDTDCNSHGTHCAGLVGSKTYGACKDAKLFAVKVLDCRGSGSMSGVIAGVEFAFKRHLNESARTGGKVRSIASMSLGGGFSRALNLAVQNCVKNSNTFYFTVAAGNENADACKTSPASVKEVLTVMASDKHDSRAYFSNYGRCADMYSPGVDIESTVPGGNTAVYSGTSMATPLLAGVLNHYIDQFPGMNMQKVKDLMLNDATKNTLESNPHGTNNLLVYLHH